MARLRHNRIGGDEGANQRVVKSGPVIVQAAGGGFEALAGEEAVGG